MDIIIETPKGSNLKYVYDQQMQLLRLKKVLAAGLCFPFDFGFIPHTKGEDNDPLDVMVISEFTGIAGCVMDCRIIGCLQIEQTAAKNKIRNDRYLAIPEQSQVYEKVLSVEELPFEVLSDIQAFLKNYMMAEGKDIHISASLTAAQAIAVLNSMSKRMP